MEVDKVTEIEVRNLLKRYLSEDTYSFQNFDELKVDTVGIELETPLHMACTRNALDDVKILIAAGAAPNAQTNIGTTPLMRAVYRKNYEMVKCLLIAGADVSLRDSYGSTALDIAQSAKGEELSAIIGLLKAHVPNNADTPP
jgi:ankyrin repeat protein